MVPTCCCCPCCPRCMTQCLRVPPALALPCPALPSALPQSYERLEFLGDSVLGLACRTLLMRRCPNSDEVPLVLGQACWGRAGLTGWQAGRLAGWQAGRLAGRRSGAGRAARAAGQQGPPPLPPMLACTHHHAVLRCAASCCAVLCCAGRDDAPEQPAGVWAEQRGVCGILGAGPIPAHRCQGVQASAGTRRMACVLCTPALRALHGNRSWGPRGARCMRTQHTHHTPSMPAVIDACMPGRMRVAPQACVMWDACLGAACCLPLACPASAGRGRSTLPTFWQMCLRRCWGRCTWTRSFRAAKVSPSTRCGSCCRATTVARTIATAAAATVKGAAAASASLQAPAASSGVCAWLHTSLCTACARRSPRALCPRPMQPPSPAQRERSSPLPA